MAGTKGRNKRRKLGRQGMTQDKMARSLDKLAQFELFDHSILPQLRKMVLEGWPPDRIRKTFAPIMQARMIQAGLGDLRSQSTMKAIKDTLDRHEGTAVQRVEQKSLYARMGKAELAALALQKLQDAEIIDVSGRVIVTDEEDEDDEE